MDARAILVGTKRQRIDNKEGPSEEEEERHQRGRSSEGGPAQEDRAAQAAASVRLHRGRSGRGSPTTTGTTGGNSLFCGNCASIQDFEKVGRLGEGTYGIVYLAKDRRKQRAQGGSATSEALLVALKRCIPHHQATDGFPVTALREIAALRACAGHPHVVRLESVAVSKSGVFLVLEYCEHDLARILDGGAAGGGAARSGPFSVAAAKTLVLDLLAAIRHCHDRCLLHRDVKPSNLLYTSRGTLKLADFGMSRFVPSSSPDGAGSPHPPLTLAVASLWYRPPELIMGATSYTSAIDMWACGCVLAEVLHGRPVLSGRTEQGQLKAIVEHLGSWPSRLAYPRSESMLRRVPTRQGQPRKLLDVFQDLSLDGLRLLTGLLHYDPQQRCTAARALASPFLAGADPPSPLPRDQMPTFAAARTRGAR